MAWRPGSGYGPPPGQYGPPPGQYGMPYAAGPPMAGGAYGYGGSPGYGQAATAVSPLGQMPAANAYASAPYATGVAPPPRAPQQPPPPVHTMTRHMSNASLSAPPTPTPQQGPIAMIVNRTAPPKKFHIFINYRVATDAHLAEKICDKLQLRNIPGTEMRITCFLDKQNLPSGKEWDLSFLEALDEAIIFLPLVSEAAIEPITRLTPDRQDNVLLEYETALALRGRTRIEILPILVGRIDGGAYHKFNGFGMQFPDTPSKSNPIRSIKETMADLFRLQGIFLNPEEVVDKLGRIADTLKGFWPRFDNPNAWVGPRAPAPVAPPPAGWAAPPPMVAPPREASSLQPPKGYEFMPASLNATTVIRPPSLFGTCSASADVQLKFRPITTANAREAMLKLAGKQYKQETITACEIKDVVSFVVYELELASVYEQRMLEWSAGPYQGGNILSIFDGKAPKAWDIPSDDIPPKQQPVTIPYSEAVLTCTEPLCRGAGRYTCTGCGGRGQATCGACQGSGRGPFNDGRPCAHCHGSRIRRCHRCSGSGVETCSKCGGGGKVHQFITLRKKDTLRRDKELYNATKALKAAMAKGKGVHELHREEGELLNPMLKTNDGTLAQHFEAFVKNHHKTQDETWRLVKQKVVVRCIPAWDIQCSLKGKDFEMTIFGADQTEACHRNFPGADACIVM